MTAWTERVIKQLRERASALVVGLSLVTVAATTGFISYTHISALTIGEHQSWKSAHLYPLAVDGQIAIGSVILMEVKGKRRWLGLIGFVPGLAESLVANWASGWQGHDLLAALWATVPAQAFACSTFLFEAWLRYRRSIKSEDASLPGSAAPAALAELPQGVVTPAAAVPVHVLPGAPGPLGWGWEGPLPAPAAAPQRPARPTAVPSAVPAAPDTRLLLPEDEGELAALVRATARNELFRTYQVSKTGADKLKARYTAEEAMTNVA